MGCNREGRCICEKCEMFLSENSFICPVCGGNSFAGETHYNCFGKYQLSGLTSVWDYDGITKKMIKRMKYGGEFSILHEYSDHFLKVIALDDTKRFSSF